MVANDTNSRHHRFSFRNWSLPFLALLPISFPSCTTTKPQPDRLMLIPMPQGTSPANAGKPKHHLVVESFRGSSFTSDDIIRVRKGNLEVVELQGARFALPIQIMVKQSLITWGSKSTLFQSSRQKWIRSPQHTTISINGLVESFGVSQQGNQSSIHACLYIRIEYYTPKTSKDSTYYNAPDGSKYSKRYWNRAIRVHLPIPSTSPETIARGYGRALDQVFTQTFDAFYQETQP